MRLAIPSTLADAMAFFRVDLSGLESRRMPIEIPDVGRRELAQCFAYCGLKVGVELGVEQGDYAEQLCTENLGLRLHCVDAWRPYRGYREHVGIEKLERFYAATQERLKPYDAIFHRAFSVDAAKEFPNGFLDFVYIDANHTLPHVIADLNAWVPKVRTGGIVSGHDYCKRKQAEYQVHVVEAVTAWTQAYQISPYFILGSKEVRDGELRDRPRSWFWVVS